MTSPARVSAPAAALLVLALASQLSAQTVPASACTSLAQRQLPNTTITVAEAVTTGSFTPPGSTNAIGSLPPFCRVAGVIAPTIDSQIRFEVWLPIDKWNGKFAGVGNGGWAGTHLVRPPRGTAQTWLRDGLDEYRTRGNGRREHGAVRVRKA